MVIVRRDERAVCCASRAARRPVPLSTTPAPLHKPRARHERAIAGHGKHGGFRLRLGGMASLRFQNHPKADVIQCRIFRRTPPTILG